MSELDELVEAAAYCEVRFEKALRQSDEAKAEAQEAWATLIAARERLDKAVAMGRAAARLKRRGDKFYEPATRRISEAFHESTLREMNE